MRGCTPKVTVTLYVSPGLSAKRPVAVTFTSAVVPAGGAATIFVPSSLTRTHGYAFFVSLVSVSVG